MRFCSNKVISAIFRFKLAPMSRPPPLKQLEHLGQVDPLTWASCPRLTPKASQRLNDKY